MKIVPVIILALAVSTSAWAGSKERYSVTKGAYDRYWIEDENGRLVGSAKKGAYGRIWIEDERGRLKGSIAPSYRDRHRFDNECEDDCNRYRK